MSLSPAPAMLAPHRHPMGLPRGSVRALLTFMVLGLVWLLLLLPEDKKVQVPIYLYYLMFLILGHYFAARSSTPVSGKHEAHPLYLPRGSIRFLIVTAFLGVLGYSLYRNPHFLERLKPSVDVLAEQPWLPLVLVAAFFAGILVTRLAEVVLAGPQGLSPWFQDVQAWIALLAVLGLGAEVVMLLIINPHATDEYRLQLPYWQSILSGIIAFYFGARS